MCGSETITITEQPPTRLPDGPLRQALADHHRRFSPIYQGFLSDHGPMGAMASYGLGRPEPEVLDWYGRYCQRLAGFDSAPDVYCELLKKTRHDLVASGGKALLSRMLPGLISGWARNAYHPLIRIAYGYQFQIEEEIAAGLAYLAWCGADPRIERLAASAATGNTSDAQTAFAMLVSAGVDAGPGRRFDDCLDTVIAHPDFAPAARHYPDALAAFSRSALHAFDQTHDFFALHLVTGAHAFRILYPFAGEYRDEIFALGILAGYTAIGAPPFSPDQNIGVSDISLQAASELGSQVRSDDDHDIKLAYSAMSQALHFQDNAYADVAARYLSR